MEIICINDQFSPEQIQHIPNRPVRDNIYTIRDVIRSQNGIGLLLNEIRNPSDSGYTTINGMDFSFEANFNQNRFTKLDGSPLTEQDLLQKTRDEKNKIMYGDPFESGIFN